MPTVIPTSNKIEPQKGKMFPPESTIAKIYMPVAPMIHKNAHTDSIRHINFAFVARIPFVNTSDTHVAISTICVSSLAAPVFDAIIVATTSTVDNTGEIHNTSNTSNMSSPRAPLSMPLWVR